MYHSETKCFTKIRFFRKNNSKIEMIPENCNIVTQQKIILHVSLKALYLRIFVIFKQKGHLK